MNNHDESAVIGEKLARTVALISKMAMAATPSGFDATAVLLSGISGPMGLLAGMVSDAFTSATDRAGPESFASEDTVLFSCLLASRSLYFGKGPNGKVVGGINLSDATLAEAIEDFKKMRPEVDIATVVRADLIEIASKATETGRAGVAMLERLIANATPGEPGIKLH